MLAALANEAALIVEDLIAEDDDAVDREQIVSCRGTVRENFLILKKSFDWLAAIRKSEEYQWRWNVNLARGPSNEFSSDVAGESHEFYP